MRTEEVLRDGLPIALTAREFELQLFRVAPPRENLREGLLNEVWDYQSTLNTRTVDFYVAQLRQKLEANPKTPCHILTAHRSGYRFVPPGMKT